MIPVTRHAEQRLRVRLRVPKRAVRRLADRAWEQGADRDRFRGVFRHYLDAVAQGAEVRVWRGAVYVYDSANPALITVWRVPPQLRGAAGRPSVAAAASGAGVDPDAPPTSAGPKSRAAGASEGSLPLNPTTCSHHLAARERSPERTDLSRPRAQGGER